MSGGDPPSHHPFGYMFDNPQSGTSEIKYPPPGDHPLLRDEESGYLDSFFNDPTNIDSHNLMSMPADFSGDGANAFANSNLDWLAHTATEFDHTPQATTPTNNAHGQPSWPSSGINMQSTTEQSPQLQPSPDVYQAAGILHNNNSAGRQQTNNNLFGGLDFGAGGANTGSNGYTYPPISNGNGMSYGYNTTAGPTSIYNSMGDRYTQAENGNAYNTTYPDGSNSHNTALNFGTDDSFRNELYAAQHTERPDKMLTETVAHNFRNSEQPRSAPVANMGKRARTNENSKAQQDDPSDDGNEPGPRKRRKGKVKDEESDGEDGNGRYDYPRKAKHRTPALPTSASSSRADAASPLKKARSAGPRPPRENLSEEQKRNNHIQSEQKRRNLIKQGFEDLTNMVPELRAGSLSKSNMLVEAARFIRKMRDDNDALEALVGPIDKG